MGKLVVLARKEEIGKGVSSSSDFDPALESEAMETLKDTIGGGKGRLWLIQECSMAKAKDRVLGHHEEGGPERRGSRTEKSSL